MYLDYQCVFGGKDRGDPTTEFLRMVEYLKIRLAGEVLDLVGPGFQLSVHEDGHGIVGWGDTHGCRKRIGAWIRRELTGEACHV